MDKEYVIKQKHIEPVDSVLNRIQIEVRSPKQNYILPNVIRSRQAKSYSVDSEISHSRFDFANQTTDCEEGDSSPELLHPPSPLETKVRI